jgi:hypothetical protein
MRGAVIHAAGAVTAWGARHHDDCTDESVRGDSSSASIGRNRGGRIRTDDFLHPKQLGPAVYKL